MEYPGRYEQHWGRNVKPSLGAYYCRGDWHFWWSVCPFVLLFEAQNIVSMLFFIGFSSLRGICVVHVVFTFVVRRRVSCREECLWFRYHRGPCMLFPVFHLHVTGLKVICTNMKDARYHCVLNIQLALYPLYDRDGSWLILSSLSGYHILQNGTPAEWVLQWKKCWFLLLRSQAYRIHDGQRLPGGIEDHHRDRKTTNAM
jgi:hypothetical protein